jgi:hypothetical protein
VITGKHTIKIECGNKYGEIFGAQQIYLDSSGRQRQLLAGVGSMKIQE